MADGSLEARTSDAFDVAMWSSRAAAGYEQLGWVSADSLLEKFDGLVAGFEGDVAVDIGTGSGEVASQIAPFFGLVRGFDVSEEMMRLSDGTLNNVETFVAHARSVPQVRDGEARFVTARMVFHHLTDEDIEAATKEGWRMLAPGGRLVVCEYVPPTNEAKAYERQIFDLKERGRQLWTGEELAVRLGGILGEGRVGVDYAILRGYSVRDWLKKGGLPDETVEQIIRLYDQMPKEFWGELKVEAASNGSNESDFLIDRPFVYVVIDKVDGDF